MDVDAAASQNTPYGTRGTRGTHSSEGTGNIALGRFSLSPLWVGVLAMLAFLILLLSFDYVVRQGVQTAELRRQNAAAHSAATWRCQALRQRQDRDDCLSTISVAAPTTASNDLATGSTRF